MAAAKDASTCWVSTSPAASVGTSTPIRSAALVRVARRVRDCADASTALSAAWISEDAPCSVSACAIDSLAALPRPLRRRLLDEEVPARPSVLVWGRLVRGDRFWAGCSAGMAAGWSLGSCCGWVFSVETSWTGACWAPTPSGASTDSASDVAVDSSLTGPGVTSVGSSACGATSATPCSSGAAGSSAGSVGSSAGTGSGIGQLTGCGGPAGRMADRRPLGGRGRSSATGCCIALAGVGSSVASSAKWFAGSLSSMHAPLRLGGAGHCRGGPRPKTGGTVRATHRPRACGPRGYQLAISVAVGLWTS